MTARKSEYKPRIVKIYDGDEFDKLLDGVQVATCMLTETPQVVDEQSVMNRLNALTLAKTNGACSTCGAGPFTSRPQQTAHYKHHWHTYNLKRRLFGKSPLTLGEFNSRQDDNSSVSGSDSEEEIYTNCSNPATDLFAAATRHCKAFYTNPQGQVFCIYRCILHHRKEDLSTDGEGHAWVSRCKQLAAPGYLRWAVLMVSGGHFAGAVFTGGTIVVHKTLHSYVTRRGQGQAQATRDSHGNASSCRSAGASLRRYNQAQFAEHVQDVLNSWSDELADCYLILSRAVGPINQGTLFGKASPLRKDDPRVRILPFPTKKPTFKEVQRVHATIANMEVYDTMEQFQKVLIGTFKTVSRPLSGPERGRKSQKSPSKRLDRAKSREPAQRELPTQIVSSEDEGPSYIDADTPVGWIKTLSEQTINGAITDSKKDLLIDSSVDFSNECSAQSDSSSDSEVEETVKIAGKKKKDKNPDQHFQRRTQKIPKSVKKFWKAIAIDQNTVETIIEKWESEVIGIVEACNVPDPNDGNTALHKAAIAKKPDMVIEILSAGGDPCLRNRKHQTAYESTPDVETRVAFRLFQAKHPNKYNYSKSQIPGPATLEQLNEDRERKTQQKRAKRQKDKERLAEKLLSNKFLEMTDLQKIKAVEENPRCFLCGSKLPKSSFQYDQYKFCGLKCLQNHRNLRPFHLPD